jgi:phospholipase C
MKLFHRALVVLLPLLPASFAAAQVQPNMFSHVIIVVQENRTPDNLFGAHAPSTPCGTLGDFPGADLAAPELAMAAAAAPATLFIR